MLGFKKNNSVEFVGAAGVPRADSEGPLLRGRARGCSGCADGRGRSCISERAGLAAPGSLLAPVPGSGAAVASRALLQPCSESSPPDPWPELLFFPPQPPLAGGALLCSQTLKMLHGDVGPGK